MKYIFLDFNGTVLDDLDICLELLNDILIKENHPTVSKERYKEIFGFPVIEYYKRAGIDFEQYSFEELADYFIVEYTRRNVIECKIFPDVKEFVDKAHSLGYKIVLCSASKLPLLLDQLDSFKIRNYFDFVIGLDNHHATSKVQLAKDFVRENNIDTKNLYFIGDTDHDAEVAISCGGKSLLVARGHQNKNVLATTKSLIFDTLLEALNYIEMN